MHAAARTEPRTCEPIPASATIDDALAALSSQGFALLQRATPASVTTCLDRLGRIIHRLDVRPRCHSRGLVTSLRELPPHTDHHRAKWIAWHCITPAKCGGTSIVVDARVAYANLTRKHQHALARIQLFEHDVFDDAANHHPLVTTVNNTPAFYYSYWLFDAPLAPTEQSALDAFRRAIDAAPHHGRLLAPGDLLIVDNHRVLHGRSEFRDKHRHLRRLWLAPHATRPI